MFLPGPSVSDLSSLISAHDTWVDPVHARALVCGRVGLGPQLDCVGASQIYPDRVRLLTAADLESVCRDTVAKDGHDSLTGWGLIIDRDQCLEDVIALAEVEADRGTVGDAQAREVGAARNRHDVAVVGSTRAVRPVTADWAERVVGVKEGQVGQLVGARTERHRQLRVAHHRYVTFRRTGGGNDTNRTGLGVPRGTHAPRPRRHFFQQPAGGGGEGGIGLDRHHDALRVRGQRAGGLDSERGPGLAGLGRANGRAARGEHEGKSAIVCERDLEWSGLCTYVEATLGEGAV